MNLLLVLPILIPLLTAALCFILFRYPRAQRFLALAGSSALLVSAILLLRFVSGYGIQVAQAGAWPAPFGITLVADLFSAIMITLTGIVALSVAAYSMFSLQDSHESYNYYPLLNILLAGVCGALLTGDLFNLYVWFEVMLIASFVLLTLGGSWTQMRGGLKYVAINLVSSALFLSAVGIIYGLTGTLNFAELARKAHQLQPQPTFSAAAMLLLVAFGVKAAAFPLFFWLPASYPAPPPAISALFAGLLTKVGVYAIIRLFTLVFIQDISFTHNLILIVAGLTMLTGILGAIAQTDLRLILSFQVISHIGYMLMGLGLFSLAGIAGSVLYLAHDILVKTALFLTAGIIFQIRRSFKLHDLGGLYSAHPTLSILFLIPALSLAGVPPLSGFFGKFALAKAGLHQHAFLIVTVSLVVGLLTLYSMSHVWTQAFWKPASPASTHRSRPPPPETPLAPSVRWMMAPVSVLALLVILVGLAIGPALALSTRAAEQLLNPSAYTHAVLKAPAQ